MPLRAAGGGAASLVPPWPDLVIGCGRNTAMPALAIRRASGGRTVAAQVQYPGVGRSEFDLLVVPEHDHLNGPRFVVTRGAVHRVTQARLAAEKLRFPALAEMPRPILSVLIGGTSKAYRLTLGRFGEFAEMLVAILRTDGGSVLLTGSRRTGAPGSRCFAGGRFFGATWDGPETTRRLPRPCRRVPGQPIGPMISEAAATGKPVHILGLDGGNAKLARFHDACRGRGYASVLGRVETWSYPVPDDTARAGAALRALALSRFEHRER
jgi:mitochondrial fission protein ELM1